MIVSMRGACAGGWGSGGYLGITDPALRTRDGQRASEDACFYDPLLFSHCVPAEADHSYIQHHSHSPTWASLSLPSAQQSWVQAQGSALHLSSACPVSFGSVRTARSMLSLKPCRPPWCAGNANSLPLCPWSSTHPPTSSGFLSRKKVLRCSRSLLQTLLQRLPPKQVGDTTSYETPHFSHSGHFRGHLLH